MQNKDLTRRLIVNGINCDGYGIVPKYPLIDPDLSPGAKALYSYFCAYSDSKTHEASPAKHRTLNELGISENTFYNYRLELIGQGYITKKNVGKKAFEKAVYIIEDKPCKFSGEPNDLKLGKKYEFIRKFGIFSKQLGYGFIPKSIMADTRKAIVIEKETQLQPVSKLIYAYHCVFAGRGKGIFDGMSKVSKPKLNHILYHLGICSTTYYKYYHPLIELNYITPYKPRENGRFKYNYYVLNERPDMKNTPEKGNIIYIEENKKKIKIERKPAPPIAPKLATKYIYANTAEYYKLHDEGDEYLHNVILEKMKEQTDLQTLFERGDDESYAKYIRLLQHAESDLLQYGGIPYNYNRNRELVTAAVHFLADFSDNVDTIKTENYETQAFITFTEALTDLICLNEEIKLRGSSVTYSNVIDRLNGNLIIIENKKRIFLKRSFIDKVIDSFTEGCQLNRLKGDEIKYPRNYMRSCIWTALINGKLSF